jgi:hypothetical protein
MVFDDRDGDSVERYATKRSIAGDFKDEALGSDKRFILRVGGFGFWTVDMDECKIDPLPVHQLVDYIVLSLGSTLLHWSIL